MKYSVLGQVVLAITCADCTDFLNRLQKKRIFAKDIQYKDSLTLEITVSGLDYPRVCILAEKHGGTVQVIHISGIHKFFRSIKKRPAVLVLISILFTVTLWVPRRVFFLFVEGNSVVSTNCILEAADKCGLRFGVERGNIRSEVIKNALLQEIPQLQWAGVNTRGCTATISVREKTTNEIIEHTENQVCSIVATRDGIIQNCTVYQGNQLCTTGQAVKAGQVLVSGYTDCGTMIKATRADAEITALTFRDLEVIAPGATAIRGQEKTEKKYYTLCVGKKLIKLSKDSGKMDASCVKIYLKKSVCLPGGFNLPLSLICETVTSYYDVEQMPMIAEEEQWLEEYSERYLKTSMIAGNIVSAETDWIRDEAFCCLRGRFACIEMIGQVKFEQMLLKG